MVGAPGRKGRKSGGSAEGEKKETLNRGGNAKHWELLNRIEKNNTTTEGERERSPSEGQIRRCQILQKTRGGEIGLKKRGGFFVTESSAADYHQTLVQEEKLRPRFYFCTEKVGITRVKWQGERSTHAPSGV